MLSGEGGPLNKFVFPVVGKTLHKNVEKYIRLKNPIPSFSKNTAVLINQQKHLLKTTPPQLPFVLYL